MTEPKTNTQIAGLENIKDDLLTFLKTNWKWLLGVGAGVGITAYLIKTKKIGGVKK